MPKNDKDSADLVDVQPDAKDIDVKLDNYEKPFYQSEVAYVVTTASFEKRCEVCRFYRQKNVYDPCLIVANDDPLPIVAGGWCNQFLAIGVELDLVDVIEDAVEDAIDGIDTPETERAEHLDGEEEDDDEDDMRTSSMLKRGMDLIAGLFLDKEVPFDFSKASGFKVIEVSGKAYWLGWYSNNFEDLEQDIFTAEGFDLYNARVKSGAWPMPELWNMHQSYLKHGVALKTFRIKHFQFALGEFDDPELNPIVKPFIKYYKNNGDVTMSHGFFYDDKHYKDNAFNIFQSFEVSTVKNGREANPYFTGFELTKEQEMLTGDDRQFVEGIIGADTLVKLEESAEARGKVLEEAGVAFKTMNVDDVSEDTSIILVTMQKVIGDTVQQLDKNNDILEKSALAVSVSAKALVATEARLGNLETSVERIKQTVLELALPGSASKSPVTQVSDDNAAAKLLTDKNIGEGAGRKLSVLEELAISMGDDPKTYANNGS